MDELGISSSLLFFALQELTDAMEEEEEEEEEESAWAG